MKIEDLGFITLIKKYEENSLLIKILSKENGLISGYAKHVKKNKYDYQIGNMVKFDWSAKNIEQLGTIKIELIKSYLSIFIENRFYLYIIDNITSLINALLFERYLENNLYNQIEIILNSIIENKNKLEIIKEYLIFQNILLNIVGSGIIFDNNEIIENLYYISPKTGLAVSKLKGEPYKDRLLLFPLLFKEKEIKKSYIFDCFDTMDFFLKKHLSDSNSKKYQNLVVLKENLLNNI